MTYLCLLYISKTSNLERKVNPTSLLNYNKYSTIGKHELAASLLLVIDKNIGAHSQSAELLGFGTTVAPSGGNIDLVEQIMPDMLTPPTFDIIRAYDINDSFVNMKTLDGGTNVSLKVLHDVLNQVCNEMDR